VQLRWMVLLAAFVVLAAGSVASLEHSASPTPESSSAQNLAPTFTLTDIYGHTFALSSYRNTSAVLIEFTALSCSECQIVEQSLHSLYASYNATGASPVKIISIYIEPQFGDTIPALQAYHAKNNITWTMAQDTPSLAVSSAYGVQDIPNVVIIDKQGRLVYDVSGVQDPNTLHTTVAAAIAQTAAPISLVTVSVFALAAVAGVSTFFSPCAFPMFPGYMGLFLGLNVKSTETASPEGKTYGKAARRAAFAGSVTALGMIVVFLTVGVALILAASVVGGSLPYLLVFVGIILVILGALLLTNLQYWRVVSVFQRLWYRLGGKRPEEAIAQPTATSGRAFYLKLFSYGMGYAAAAAGCVAPVIFSAILAGLALGLLGGIVNILIFTLTAALLMVTVTVLLAMAGQRFINQLKAATPIIKKVSAVALIVVGVYLVYFYYAAWGF
jgi:cytochrome c-type biogenesis protein